MTMKKRLPETTNGINIMPLMNIIMLLIPFLIMSTEFVRLAVIESTAPLQGPIDQKKASEKPPTNPLLLTIALSDRGFQLRTRTNKIPNGCDLKQLNQPTPDPVTIPKIGKQYNYQKLNRCLTKLKLLFPKEERAILTADKDVPYEKIIATMDATREDLKHKPLFPKVVISPGIF